MTFEAETKANFEKFYAGWTAQVADNWAELHKSDLYVHSYRRISAVNSVRVDVLDRIVPGDALSFFLEAHNDLLQSHVNAAVGSWRVALKSVRSFVENSFNCIYFADHAIELRNWERGKSRPGFTELTKYLENHPDLVGLPVAKAALESIVGEYATLSKAVHGSAKSFRMTDNVGQTLLWSTKVDKIGAWATREAAAISNVLVLLLAIYKEQLSGAKLPGCRQALSAVYGPKMRQKIKADLAITIPSS